MKYKLKTRLFAALALSGASFYWPASALMAQEGDFGFIRPAEPTHHDQEVNVQPVAQVMPPIVNTASRASLQPKIEASPPVVQPSAARSAPVAFASSSVFDGAYVPQDSAGVGHAEHLSPAHGSQLATARQVSHDEPVKQPSVIAGIQAERNLPPIVSVTAGIHQPIEQNELPPILLPSQANSQSELPPIVTANQGLGRLLKPIEIDAANADGSSLDSSSKVEPASFGASPLLIQDAPPIVNGVLEADLPGALPPFQEGSIPIDPTVDLSGGDSFPRALPSAEVAPRSVFEGGLPIQPQTAPRETYFEPVAQQAPVYGGCSSCGAGGGNCGCGGAHGSGVSECSSCGEGGCFDPAAVEAMFNSSGSNAYARRYFIAEALYYDRTDGLISNSNFGSLNDFDPGGGARITVGRRSDSTRGREFQYSGIEGAEEDRLVLNDIGLIQSQFVATGGLNAANISAFSNATRQEESKETAFHSLEFNRVKWGWDVIKSYLGFRYIYFDDEYSILSNRRAFTAAETGGFPTAAEAGEFQISTVNHLFGPHIGGELYYDIGYRWSLSGVSRAGLYLNINETDTSLTNNGTQFINTEDTNATIAFTYEAGLNAKYRLTQQSQFRVGYNIFFLDNLATVSDNLNQNTSFGNIVVSPTLGASASDSDSAFFHGLSFGFEVYR